MKSFAKLGFYSDQQSSSTIGVSRQMVDRFVEQKFDGVIFEITAGIDTTGRLLNTLTYNELFNLIRYASEKGLDTGLLTNFNFNNGNADYVPQSWANGKSPPAEFSLDTAVRSIGEFYKKLASNPHFSLVDQIYLTQESTDYYGAKYRPYWEEFISSFRKSFSGQISTTIFSSNKYVGSVADYVKIWDLLDFISIWERTHTAEDSSANFQDIVSSYFESTVSFGSVIDEIQRLSDTYNKPIQMGKNVMSKPDALDGGWDQTIEQAMSRPLPLNPVLQKMAYEAFLQVVSNNLRDEVNSIFIGNFEPWTYGDWSTIDRKAFPEVSLWETFKYFDLSLFPADIMSSIKSFNQSDQFIRESTTTGSRGNDEINLSVPGVIYPKGGTDSVLGSFGADRVVIEPHILSISLRVDVGVWYTSKSESELNSRLAVSQSNNTVFEKKLSDIAPKPTSTSDQWLRGGINVSIDPASDLSLPFRFDLLGPGLVQLDIRGIYTDKYYTINDETFNHSGKKDWQQLNWVTQGDTVSVVVNPSPMFNLAEILRKSKDIINGNSGIDIISIPVDRKDLSLTINGSATKIEFGQTQSLFNTIDMTSVERIELKDSNLVVDLIGSGGQAYRVYKAAFNRDPMNGDKGGLGYWIGQMDRGMGLLEVSARFVDSNEFRSLYGTNPTNEQFLNKLYTNVLGRQPEASGYNWWLNQLNTNPEKTKAKVLADFAESAENQAGVISLIGNGITYEPWAG